MPQRRVQVQEAQEAPALRPAAAPISTYYVPKLPQATQVPVIDLSPLSDTLTKIKLQQQEVQAQADLKIGRAAAANAPQDILQEIASATKDLDTVDARRKAGQEIWAKKVASGEAKEAWSPWTWVGFNEVASRTILGAYERDLKARLSEVSQLVDPQTGLPQNPGDPQKILDEVWQKYAGNGIFADLYGGEQVAQLKPQIDNRFLSSASDAQGAAAVKERERMLTNEVGQRFALWSDGEPPKSEDYAFMQDYITEVGRRRSVQPDRLRAIVLNAALDTAITTAEVDAGQAARLLRFVRDVRVGPARLADDVEISAQLSERINRYDDLKEQDDNRELERKPRRRTEAINEGVGEFVSLMREAETRGDSKWLTFEKWNAQQVGEQRWGEFTPAVLEAARRTAREGESEQRPENPNVVDALNFRLSTGEGLDALASDARSAAEAGEITWATAGQFVDKAASRKNLAHLLEQNGTYLSAVNDIGNANKLNGYPTEIQAKYDAEYDSVVREFKTKAADFARTIVGSPNEDALWREWIATNAAPVTARLQKRGTDVAAQRTQALEAVNDLLRHYQDATPAIDAAQNAGLLTDKEAKDARERSDSAGDLARNFYSRPAFLEAQQDVEIAVSVALEGSLKGNATGSALLAGAKEELKTRAAAWLADNLETTPPGRIMSKFDAAIPEIVEEATKDFSTVNFARIKAQKAAGVQVTSIADQGRVVQADKAAAEAVAKSDRTTASRALVSATAGSNALVDPGLVDLQKKFLARESGVFSGRVSRSAVLDRTLDVAREISANPDIPEAARNDAILAAIAPMGIPAEDVLKGATSVDMSPETRASLTQRLTNLRDHAQNSWVSRAFGPTGAVSQEIEALSKKLAVPPIPLPLDKAALLPYTTSFFKTQDEIKSWIKDRPADLEALMQRLSIPDNDVARQEWLSLQILATKRVNPDAQ